MRQSIIDDEFWTPKSLYDDLCKKYSVLPLIDVAANADNSKCRFHLYDALHQEWVLDDDENKIKTEYYCDIWCNPPHTKTEEFIRRAESQHLKHGITIMMIVPANVLSTKVWHQLIENKREYHAIEGRPKFLKHGVPSKFPSRNAYVVILWYGR